MLENHMALPIPDEDPNLIEDFEDIEIFLNGKDDYEAVCEWLDPDWRERPDGYDCYDYFDSCKSNCPDELRAGIVTLHKGGELPSQQEHALYVERARRARKELFFDVARLQHPLSAMPTLFRWENGETEEVGADT